MISEEAFIVSIFLCVIVSYGAGFITALMSTDKDYPVKRPPDKPCSFHDDCELKKENCVQKICYESGVDMPTKQEPSKDWPRE